MIQTGFMRNFRCECGERVFFDNSRCLRCGLELGFLPDQSRVASLKPSNGAYATSSGEYRKCTNYSEQGVCNWMVPSAEPDPLCEACRLNNVIPDLSSDENRRLWAEVERAKRRLVFGLKQLGLPLVSKNVDAERGIAFDIKSGPRVLTGHSEGLITMNLAEADDVTREKVRASMNERYRTLLGHFRHEVGHFYWERLIAGGPFEAEFRALFGDERENYSEALQRHYAFPSQSDWSGAYISQYATAHPWEDWAETFAHYLHITDTLETAAQFGFASLPQRVFSAGPADIEALVAEWTELSVALNALNRSMGMPDAYPFAIAEPVQAKLGLVLRAVRAAPDRMPTPAQ
jgi:hypothetical protein